MYQNIKDRWVAALRSGNYRQGTGQLRDKNDCFCVMGVLCDLFVADGLGEWVRHTEQVWTCFGLHCSFPSPVKKWAGLLNEISSLIRMNDSEGATFAELADRIEAGDCYE